MNAMETAELLGLGPTVAIIDDIEREVISLRQELDKRNVGNHFFKVDISDPTYPDQPLSTVQLVFLDLNYDTGFGAQFDAYMCVNWLSRVIPEGHHYSLVVWSKDHEKTDELLEVMRENGVPMPFFVATKQKDRYRNGHSSYDIEKLLTELNITAQKEIDLDTQEYTGQIVEVDENHVLINCLLHQNPLTFEVRRFDKIPFTGYLDPTVGKFIRIRVTTKPGAKTFEFSEETEDKADLFLKNDDLESLGDTSFLNEDSQ